MDIWKKGNTILVVGAGKSGLGAIHLLCETGYDAVLFDEKETLDREKIYRQEKRRDFTIVLGSLPEEYYTKTAICVVSPGVWLNRPYIGKLRQNGVPIISEIALAYHFSKGKVIGITGTNGKTTTTALTAHILKGANPSTFALGNIGIPYSKEVLNVTEDSVSVIEISSLQLSTFDGFQPDVSVITNITPDHLDRHGTYENYIAIKKKIAALQTPDQYCVINRETPELEDMPKHTQAKILYFSSARELEEGAFLRGGEILLRRGGTESVICRTGDLNIIGRHNYENVMAAALASAALGAPLEVISSRVRTFQAVPHRIEYVATIDGVRYYNDSKGTNPDSSIKAMESMTGPTIVIAGGYDKKADFTDWVKTFEGKVKLLILMGQTAEQIAETVRRFCPVPWVRVGSMEEAVAIARENAVSGDTVLLSPACASWDMYPNFEVRGDHFKELVRAAQQKAQDAGK